MDKRTWTGLLSNALHRKFFVINIIMTYCALAAHLCFMQTIVLSPYMTTFMALARDYGRRVTKCVLTATRTSELNISKTNTGILAAANHWFCLEIYGGGKESPLEQKRVSHHLPLLTHSIFAVAALQDMKCYLIVNFKT